MLIRSATESLHALTISGHWKVAQKFKTKFMLCILVCYIKLYNIIVYYIIFKKLSLVLGLQLA